MEEVEDKRPIFIKDLGMQYPTETSVQKSRYGLYKCGYCSKEFRARTYCIKSGRQKSCGCLGGEKHNLTHHKLYGTWTQMKDRCNNEHNSRYKDYGGRGILVCNGWLDIKNFIEWADSTHPNTEGYTLDRVDNDKGYSPDNCTWSDTLTQSLNRRLQKSNTSGYVGISWSGKSKRWRAYLRHLGKAKEIGRFKTIEEAVEARDNYIISNNLPHKLSTEYKKE